MPECSVTIHPRRPCEEVVTLVAQIGDGLYQANNGHRVSYDDVQARDLGEVIRTFGDPWHSC